MATRIGWIEHLVRLILKVGRCGRLVAMVGRDRGRRVRIRLNGTYSLELVVDKAAVAVHCSALDIERAGRVIDSIEYMIGFFCCVIFFAPPCHAHVSINMARRAEGNVCR